MSVRDYPSSDPLENQDIIHLLTVEELRDLSNFKEMRRSLSAIISHFEEKEGAIFQAARARAPKDTGDSNGR